MGAIKAVFRSWDNPRAIVLPPHERHPLRLGHRRQRPVHGLRQHRRYLRHRRRLHPQPRHRRKEAVRRVPDERAGRGRRGRRPHPAAPSTSWPRSCPRHTSSLPISAPSSKITTAICRIWSSPLRTSKLYMLQTRNGKRTAAAAMKIACDLVDEGMITEEEAVAMIDPKQPRFSPAPDVRSCRPEEGQGRRHGPGRVSGRCLRSDRFLRRESHRLGQERS